VQLQDDDLTVAHIRIYIELMAKGFVGNIDELTLSNKNFRTVIYTTKKSQLVLMNLKPLEEIGLETHNDNDQFIKVESGTGKVIFDGIDSDIGPGSAIVIPSGTEHNVRNTSDSESLKMYTLYTPPHHKLDVIHETKEEASNDDEEFDGQTDN
jgi:mannose-6-phosphate isomerase-like protein (cupin superfamily)